MTVGDVHFIESVGCVVEVGRVNKRRRSKAQILTRPNPHLYQIVPGVYIGHPVAVMAARLKLMKDGVL